MPKAAKSTNAYVGFKRLKGQLSKRPDVHSPGGLSASIGPAKYGQKAFQRAAASGRPLGHNPNLLIHYYSAALFNNARKKAIELARQDVHRTGRPVAIVDAARGRVLKFIRPPKARPNPAVRPRKAEGRVRFRKVGRRTRIEVYR